MLVKKCGQDMKATTLNNCNKRQQSASAEEGREAVWWEGGPCRVAGHKQIGRCTAADADMSSTCRSRRSTKSIPGILLPRSCLAQSVAAHKGRQRVRQQRVKRRKGGGWTVWSDAAIDRLQFMDSCSQFKCNCCAAVELAVGVVYLPPSLPPSLPSLMGHTNSRRPLTMDPKLKPRAEPESQSTRLTHTALWKLENYFHCCTGGAAGAGVAGGGSGRLWLRLVSKRHKRVLY